MLVVIVTPEPSMAGQPPRGLADVAGDLGLAPHDITGWGPGLAKLTRPALRRLTDAPRGRLVLVSAITPTRRGEGKTTMSIGLAQGLVRRGHRAVAALRQPSLGPIFGAKGGGTGGGRCRIEPSVRINLGATGDLHAVTAAHGLLAALVDNALHHGLPGGGPPLDARTIVWRRALDMNDRFLRNVVIGLGGREHGVVREDGFDITAASEVMAILCLATDLLDVKSRLARIVIGERVDGAPVTAADLRAPGAMAALLADASLPNLAQTTEGVPVLVHGGPFGNIAHGCSSLIATRAALGATDWTITEAGFGFDLGGEKFLDIACRAGGVWPSAVVLVATVRGLVAHGSAEAGFANLLRHAHSARAFGFEPIVAINRFAADSDADVARLVALCAAQDLRAAACTAFSEGGAGAEALADLVVAAGSTPHVPRWIYDLADAPERKMEAIARAVYGADGVALTPRARRDLKRASGASTWPICMAKTHLSLSDDAKLLGRPTGFTISVREVRVRAGAGYLLAITGDVLTMPGLPSEPAAQHIDVQEDGTISGVE
jgi:formate--tetrahydrofolate ligase